MTPRGRKPIFPHPYGFKRCRQKVPLHSGAHTSWLKPLLVEQRQSQCRDGTGTKCKRYINTPLNVSENVHAGLHVLPLPLTTPPPPVTDLFSGGAPSQRATSPPGPPSGPPSAKRAAGPAVHTVPVLLSSSKARRESVRLSGISDTEGYIASTEILISSLRNQIVDMEAQSQRVSEIDMKAQSQIVSEIANKLRELAHYGIPNKEFSPARLQSFISSVADFCSSQATQNEFQVEYNRSVVSILETTEDAHERTLAEVMRV